MHLEFCIWLLYTFSTMLEPGWPIPPGGASARSMQCPVKNTLNSDGIQGLFAQGLNHLCHRYLGLSYSCCSLLGVLLLSFQVLLCPWKEVILSPTKGQASPRAAREAHPNQNSSGDSFPYHQAWEAWGQGKINIRMHLSQQLFPTPCRAGQTIPSSNEHSFKEW